MAYAPPENWDTCTASSSHIATNYSAAAGQRQTQTGARVYLIERD
jgi:hypothetical protein